MAIKSKNSGSASKKALLKKIIGGKKIGGGLGSKSLIPSMITGGGGSNLGKNGIF